MKAKSAAKVYKPKKCQICEEYFVPVKQFQPCCFPPKDCWKVHIINQKKKQFAKQCKKEKDAYYEKEKKLDQLEHEARKQFQAWIKLRDKNEPCISCQTTFTRQWDGGHFFKAELYSAMIFNEMNCHKQCCYCNNHLDANLLEYRKGLIKRYGVAYVEELEKIKDSLRSYKYSKNELIEIKAKYKEKIKQLKSNS
jgi:hypothetical protein